MAPPALLTDRAILAVSGSESRGFLQGLLTNDLRRLTPEHALYTALLTPQGKILVDFLVYERGPDILLDCAQSASEDLARRLALYKLRAKIVIARRDDLAVAASWEDITPATGAWPDPRLPALGWRMVVEDSNSDSDPSGAAAFQAHRLTQGIPEGADFGRDAMFALDADLDELHGVAFDKGCYVGQELTARMKHRGTARKRLLPIETDGQSLEESGAAVLAAGREIGIVTSTYGMRGFALLRLDRLAEAEGVVPEVAGTPIRVNRPGWLFA